MNCYLVIQLLAFLVCSLHFATVLSQDTDSSIYPVFDNSFCAPFFVYKGVNYTNCTTDGDNGDILWCSLTTDYKGLISYCYDFRYTTLTCLPSYTMPNGKVYTGCDFLSPTAKYKQCKTNDPIIKYRYCTDELDSDAKPNLVRNDNCSSVYPAYEALSYDHTMCYGPSPYANATILTADEKQGLLDIHNQYRAAVTSKYMFKLYWDDELAKLAQAHSNLCAFEHDLAVNRLSPLYKWTNGQNIVMSTEIKSAPASLIDAMLSSEQPNFRYGDTCYPGENSCLHYTQAMLSNLTRVGCGQTNCVYPDRIERYLTCNYIQSQYEDNYETPYIPSDTPGSACPKTVDSDGLCDCNNKICQYDLDEYLDPNTCQCLMPKPGVMINKRHVNDFELDRQNDHFIASPGGKSNMQFDVKRHINDFELDRQNDHFIASPAGKDNMPFKRKRGFNRVVPDKDDRKRSFNIIGSGSGGK